MNIQLSSSDWNMADVILSYWCHTCQHLSVAVASLWLRCVWCGLELWLTVITVLFLWCVTAASLYFDFITNLTIYHQVTIVANCLLFIIRIVHYYIQIILMSVFAGVCAVRLQLRCLHRCPRLRISCCLVMTVQHPKWVVLLRPFHRQSRLSLAWIFPRFGSNSSSILCFHNIIFIHVAFICSLFL